MLRRKKIMPVLLIGFLVGGCVMRIPDPGAKGARLYTDKCGLCHALPHPQRNRYEEWRHYLKLMKTNMEHQGMNPLTDDERATILDYLKKHSR
ncbi:MAG: c-type cytochrome [bacterium]